MRLRSEAEWSMNEHWDFWVWHVLVPLLVLVVIVVIAGVIAGLDS